MNLKDAAPAGEVAQPWGFHRVLGSGPGVRIRIIAIRSGQALERQRHHRRSEHWTVLSGTGWVRLGRPQGVLEVLVAKRGDCLQLERGEWHYAGVDAGAKQPLVVLQVWFGEELSDEDLELAPIAEAV